jgi:hypothetical protein
MPKVSPERRHGSAKAAVLRDPQERLHAVERALRTVKFCFIPHRHYRE